MGDVAWYVKGHRFERRNRRVGDLERYSDEQISNRRHKLMKLQHDAERKSFPTGLPVKERLFAAAQSEAQDYFATMDRIE
jgi:hypothetical protein